MNNIHHNSVSKIKELTPRMMGNKCCYYSPRATVLMCHGNQGLQNRGCRTVLLQMNREIHLPYRQWSQASWYSELVKGLATTYPGDDQTTREELNLSTSKTLIHSRESDWKVDRFRAPNVLLSSKTKYDNRHSHVSLSLINSSKYLSK